MRKSFVIMLIASVLFLISMTLIGKNFMAHSTLFLISVAGMIWADQEDKKSE